VLGDDTARPVGPKPEALRAETGVGFLGRGRAPSPPARGLESPVSSPSGVRGEAPAEIDFGAFPSL